MPRRSFKQITEKDSNFTLERYNDNVVTLAPTACGVQPVGNVLRWGDAEKKHQSVNQAS
ncbi:hypothetical protein J6590_009252 [Homalodisca vitripennis]|nr:hypothetical protein J6590_009252 [Homalodisca vitripennis]